MLRQVFSSLEAAALCVVSKVLLWIPIHNRDAESFGQRCFRGRDVVR